MGDVPEVSRLEFEMVEGIPQARWDELCEWIWDEVPPERWAEVWKALSERWIERLAEGLGAPYRVTKGEQFLLVSGAGVDRPEELMRFVESSFARLRSLIGPAEEPPLYGMRVAIAFDDAERYYSYLAGHHPDGEFGGSAGMCLRRRGYRHVVVIAGHGFRQTLVHELTHLALSDYKTPRWIEEGLARYMPQYLSGVHRFVVNREMVGRHRAYWRAHPLSTFWTGQSFDGAVEEGEGQELSYHLAELLVRNVMTDHPEGFRKFVRAAHRKDGGEEAARRCLGCSLDAVAAAFLGDEYGGPAGGDVPVGEGAAPARKRRWPWSRR